MDNSVKCSINEGLLVLVGIAPDDDTTDIDWLSKKIVRLRIFNDENNKMNKSLLDIGGDILLVSQFTLHASTKKGNRPSYIKAAPPEIALSIYKVLIKKLEEEVGKKISTGEFGADMSIALVNDGPVTISIDSKNKQ